ncbi:response regulator [Bacteriovorax stolpii]|uniref:response regulator n=1 Tax=Bacteriovorax stolpii TaxID=960 RepID=UPI00163C17E7|nr:response regulator [Bacteriovorax stolpii]
MKQSILIIEEDPDIKDTLNELFSSCEFEVNVASCKEEVLDNLSKRIPNFILTDLKIPGLNNDGEVLSLLQESTDKSRVKIIVMSTNTDIAIVARKYDISFLKKPFELSALLDAFR